MKLSKLTFKFFLLIILFSQSFSILAEKLDYQDRGDRLEGILPEPVGSFDIELLSAMAFQETIDVLPDNIMLKFVLPIGAQKPYVKVRELEQDVYYRMDEPKLQKQDSFKWDASILKQAVQEKGLQINNLGVVARLKGGDEPLVEEEVAPVLLYVDKPPKAVSKYTFVFKTNADAELKYFILRDKDSLLVQELGRKTGRKPFEVRWDATNAPEGYYKLLIKGYFRKDSSPISQSVRFYHKPTS